MRDIAWLVLVGAYIALVWAMYRWGTAPHRDGD